MSGDRVAAHENRRGKDRPVQLEKNELAALTRLFSPAVFRELAATGQSGLFSRLIKQSPISASPTGRATVADAFERAFRLLRSSGNRDEYVYRSAITQKIVLGKHSLSTASVLHEFRAGSSKADVVVLNGTATAYEIKSERDSLARLSSQIDNYRRVFASVAVVASPKHVPEIRIAVPEDVGILVLSDRYTIQVEREPTDCPARTSTLMVLDAMRSAEAVSLLAAIGVEVPPLPNTKLRSALVAEFARLDPTVVHELMVATLKQTRSQSTIRAFVDEVPSSLRAAALSTPIKPAAQKRISAALSSPLEIAMTWS